MDAADHIPVTILTGFLGSGKTTVLNHLLRQPELNGVVAIINEFGEVALDHLLVESSEDRLALLDNGCICCSVREDLIETLADLASRRAAGTIPPFLAPSIHRISKRSSVEALAMFCCARAYSRRSSTGSVVK